MPVALTMVAYIECQSKVSKAHAFDGAIKVLRAVKELWFTDQSLKMESKYQKEMG